MVCPPPPDCRSHGLTGCAGKPGDEEARKRGGACSKKAPKPPRTFLDYSIDRRWCSIDLSRRRRGLSGRRRGRKPATPPDALLGRGCKCRPGSATGDARGGAPCIRKLRIPLPHWGRGEGGDRGQESKLKAGLAGEEENQPPRRMLCLAGAVSAARVQPPGMQGAEPLA